MSWFATVLFKSGNNVQIDDLIAVRIQQPNDSITDLTDFTKFLLPSGKQLTFIGKKNVVSLFSSEIEYVDFSMKN